MSAEPDIIEGEENDEPEDPIADPPWASGEDDPMAAPLSKWAPTPILARLEVVASTQFWSAQLLVRPDVLESIDLVQGYREVILSLALDFPPAVSRLGREIFALLDDERVNRDMGRLARVALRRALDAARPRLAAALADLWPCRMEIHAYLLEGGGAAGTARDVGDDLGGDDNVDELLVAKAVTVVWLMREIAALLSDDAGTHEFIPVRAAG